MGRRPSLTVGAPNIWRTNGTAVLIRTGVGRLQDSKGFGEAHQRKVLMGGSKRCRSFCARTVDVANMYSLDDSSGEWRSHGDHM